MGISGRNSFSSIFLIISLVFESFVISLIALGQHQYSLSLHIGFILAFNSSDNCATLYDFLYSILSATAVPPFLCLLAFQVSINRMSVFLLNSVGLLIFLGLQYLVFFKLLSAFFSIIKKYYNLYYCYKILWLKGSIIKILKC